MVKYSKEPNNLSKSCKARGSDLRLQFKHSQPAETTALLHQIMDRLDALSTQFATGFADLRADIRRLDARVEKLIERLEAERMVDIKREEGTSHPQSP